MIKLNELCLIWDNQTLWPKQALQFSQAKSSPDQCHLVAGVYQKELFRFNNDPHLYICSIQMSIYQIILGYLNCSLDFEISNDNFGGVKVNDRWTGILALLDQKKADFIPYVYSLVSGREELLNQDFVIPRPAILTILSYPKVTISTSVSKLLGGFDVRIWILILASFVVVGLTISAISCIQYFYNYLDLFAVLYGQGMLTQPPNPTT